MNYSYPTPDIGMKDIFERGCEGLQEGLYDKALIVMAIIISTSVFKWYLDHYLTVNWEKMPQDKYQILRSIEENIHIIDYIVIFFYLGLVVYTGWQNGVLF